MKLWANTSSLSRVSVVSGRTVALDGGDLGRGKGADNKYCVDETLPDGLMLWEDGTWQYYPPPGWRTKGANS